MSRQVRYNELKTSPLAQRLVRALRKAGLSLPEPDDRYALHGAASGWSQKSAGAWAWELCVYSRRRWQPMGIGSSDPASSLRKNSLVEIGDTRHDIEISITTPKRKSK